MNKKQLPEYREKKTISRGWMISTIALMSLLIVGAYPVNQLYQFIKGLETDTINEYSAGAGVTAEKTKFIDGAVQMYTTAATPSHSEGLYYWDSTNKSISYYNDESDVTLQVGQELWIRVYNDTGGLIDNGELCYLSGINGVFPTVAKAIADDAATCLSTIGMATHSIEDSTYGYITGFGRVNATDTSGGSAGDIIYLSAATAGAWTTTEPSSPNYGIRLGNIIVSHASTGSVQINLHVGSNTKDVTKYWNGSILEDHTTTVTSDGATITLDLEKTGGGDLSLFFDGGFDVIDTTPAATVSLSAGTDTVPVLNYVFIPLDTMILTANTTGWDETQQIVHVATVTCQSAASLQTDGALKHHAWTDHLSNSVGQGHSTDNNFWIRSQPATWIDGAAMTPTLGAAQYDVATATGNMLQLHKHPLDAFNTATGSDCYVVNNFATPYAKVGDLTGQTLDNTGTTLANKHFSFVFWESGNEGSGNDKLYCNLPSGSYNSYANAISDDDKYSVYTIPAEFKGTGILIARVTASLSGTTWTLRDTEDLRDAINPGGGSSGNDADAIHDNVANEISALSTVTAATGDFILIEDVSDSNNKKNVLASDFLAGAGDVSKVGIPVDNQVGVWTGDGTLEGTSGLTYDGSNLLLTGDFGATATRITKGWFTDLQVTNAIAGSITGNAATVSTITGLAPDTATTQAIQASITSAANLVTVGTLSSGNATAIVDAASDTAAGKVELATTAETTTGTDATRAVTPDGLKDGYQGSANVVTLGTIATGVWQGTAIDGAYVDIEGTEIKSTGEAGGTKFLREDGDGTCSWQAASGGGSAITITEKTAAYPIVDGDTSGTIFVYPYTIAADYTVTFPTLSANLGDDYSVQNMSTQVITLIGEQISTDAVDSATTTIITASGHSAIVGSLLRMTSGGESGEWRMVIAVDATTITLEHALSGAPSAAETFEIREALGRRYTVELGQGEIKKIVGGDLTIDQWMIIK